jgi:pyruvate formate-lyase/glycerol dehydratase family glycyl radical enzyme
VKFATARIERMRARYMATTPGVDTERALFVTDAYRETEGEPGVLRRAKTLKKILDNMTIIIADDELIVGNQGKTYRGASVFPEYGIEWIYNEFENGTWEKRTTANEIFLISNEDKKVLYDIRDYWADKTVSRHLLKNLPEGTEEMVGAGVISYIWPDLAPSAVGHFNVNYKKLLEKGFLGIKKDAEEQLEKLGLRKNGRDIEKYYFWKAVIIVCEAAANFGKRFSTLAKELATAEKKPDRKADLLIIAKNCEQVPANPATNFHEAIQSFWFLQLLMHIDANHPGETPGRFDQYMYPYYKKDVDEGRITKTGAQELLECLWIKFAEINKLKSIRRSLGSGGYSSGQNILLGGQTKDGRDATNDLSYMMCDAQANLSFHEPSLTVRIWNGTPDELWQKAIETTKTVGGLPAFQNDEIIIPQLLKNGYSIEDARDYCIIGCVEPAGSGNTFPCCGGNGASNFFNLPQALLLAINNGINPIDGKQAGLATGYLYDFNSFEQVKEAYRKQIEFFTDWHITVNNTWELVNQHVMPLPLTSAVMDGCIESGKDVTSGGARYNFSGTAGVGTSNVGDALAAIKKLIFDDKKYTGRQLLEAINKDWEGYEPLRNEVINSVSKFGNDEPYVDELTRWATSLYCRRVNEGINPRGKYVAGLWPMTLHVIMGLQTAATLDGRKKGEPLADGISPRQGLDRNGPTSIVKSAAKLDQMNTMNGTLLNMRFHPNAVKGQEGTEKLRSVIETYFDMKGMQVQLNVVSAETLRDAQKNPDQYKNLVVRVAGYSAFFVELHTIIQNDIISRTEHAA